MCVVECMCGVWNRILEKHMAKTYHMMRPTTPRWEILYDGYWVGVRLCCAGTSGRKK